MLRSVAVMGLALVLMFLVALAVIGCLPVVHAAFEQLFDANNKTPSVALGITALFVIAVPLRLVFVAARKRWLTWPVLAAAWAAVAMVLAWLAWDEPALRHPESLEEFSPAFPGAEQSFAVLMRYSKQTPSDEARAFEKIKLSAAWGGPANTREPAKWLEFVRKNREALEADWTVLAPQRRWLDELNAFPRIGDLTPADPEANLITFQVWRTLSQRTCAVATLRALDGHGDEAIATLLPMLEAGRKLQPSSRTLVRSMIGVVVERMCLETADIVLDHASVSPADRQRLTLALAGDDTPALARRLLLVDNMQLAPTISLLKLGDHLTDNREHSSLLRRPLNFFSALLLNPIATRNLLSDFHYEMAALAETRELGQLAVRNSAFTHSIEHHPGMKNLGGRLLSLMAVPAYQKVTESFWKTADLREALRKRLAAAPVA